MMNLYCKNFELQKNFGLCMRHISAQEDLCLKQFQNLHAKIINTIIKNSYI